jgi:steroid 5-alpha reductase family enzyme
MVQTNKEDSFTVTGSPLPTYRMILVTLLVIIWALRLSIYIALRKKTEDYRYKKMREDWEKNGTVTYFLISFFVVFML